MPWSAGYVADLPYTYGFYPQLAPSFLSFVVLTSGMRGPSADQPLKYCELACGQGFSTNLLAAANPHVQFYANDFNPSHIVEAQHLANESSINNVAFFDQSFSEFLEEKELPQFDIIACHGIYSWVSQENRAIIVEFVRRRLKPGGILYLSYNALPGWAGGAPLQRLLYLFGRLQGGPSGQQINAALSFVNRLAQANSHYFMDDMIKNRLDLLNKHEKAYLVHEYLNDNWTPFYHYEVVRDLSDAKLTFIGSSNLLSDIDAINLTPEQRQILSEIGDTTLRTTVRDYIMRNTQFRTDIFVKGAVALSPDDAQDRWMATRFALPAKGDVDELKVRTALGEVGLDKNLYLPILGIFSDAPLELESAMKYHEISSMEYSELFKSLTVLVAGGYLAVCLDERGEENRTASTKSFNDEILQRSAHFDRLHYLASPRTGSGVAVSRVSQLFLLSHEWGQPEPVTAVWGLLSRQGHKLRKDGNAIEGEKENLAELRAQYEVFLAQTLPALRRLAVC